MINLPKVSVIVPVYKAESYIKRCVDSIRTQSFTDIEILLIDDGSPDSSGKICDSLAKEDERIHVFHKCNEGVTAARRDGVNMCRGEWVMFVDADDTIPCDSIELLYNNITSPLVDIVMGAWLKYLGKKSRIIPLSIIGNLNSEEYIISLLKGKTFSGPVGKIYRRNLFDKSIFDINKEITKNEDLIMNLKLAQKVRSIKACPQIIVYNYFQNEGSASKQCAPISTYDLIFENLLNLLDVKYKKYVWRYISEMFLNHKTEKRFQSSRYYDPMLSFQDNCSVFSLVWHNINVIKSNSPYSRFLIFSVRICNLVRKMSIYMLSRFAKRISNLKVLFGNF